MHTDFTTPAPQDNPNAESQRPPRYLLRASHEQAEDIRRTLHHQGLTAEDKDHLVAQLSRRHLLHPVYVARIANGPSPPSKRHDPNGAKTREAKTPPKQPEQAPPHPGREPRMALRLLPHVNTPYLHHRPYNPLRQGRPPYTPQPPTRLQTLQHRQGDQVRRRVQVHNQQATKTQTHPEALHPQPHPGQTLPFRALLMHHPRVLPGLPRLRTLRPLFQREPPPTSLPQRADATIPLPNPGHMPSGQGLRQSRPSGTLNETLSQNSPQAPRNLRPSPDNHSPSKNPNASQPH